jgi:hypothetical protein
MHMQFIPPKSTDFMEFTDISCTRFHSVDHMYRACTFSVVQSLATMPTKTLGAVYLVESKFFSAAVLRNYRANHPSSETKSRLVKVKVLGLVPGKRSYECEVLGTRENVSLSSKSLAELYASGSCQPSQEHSDTSSECRDDSAGSVDEIQQREDTPDADVHNCHSRVTASDWRTVAHFDDQLADRHPAIDIISSGRLRSNVGMTPCALFLAFFPMSHVEPCFEGWRKHAAEHDRRGLSNLDSKMFMRFIALVLRMGLLGLRRRDHHFTPEVKSTAMSQTTFESLLYTVRDVGFPGYEERERLPDGRAAVGNDPLKFIRRFADQLVQEWQEVFVPGTTLVADETMVGWTGATNIHITYLPNKPTDKGVCLKTLCDARTRVMINLEFVEGNGEQEYKRYADEGRAAAVCLRLTEPWHNQVPRVLIADAWFGGVPTAVGLIRRGW